MLPFKPESLDSMRRRFDAALVETFEVWNPLLPAGAGELRRCVFDRCNGLRLILSFDRISPEAPAMLHVSGGICPGTALSTSCIEACKAYGAYVTWAHDFQMDIIRSFRLLSGRDVPLWIMRTTSRAVHFMGPTREQWDATPAGARG